MRIKAEPEMAPSFSWCTSRHAHTPLYNAGSEASREITCCRLSPCFNLSHTCYLDFACSVCTCGTGTERKTDLVMCGTHEKDSVGVFPTHWAPACLGVVVRHTPSAAGVIATVRHKLKMLMPFK